MGNKKNRFRKEDKGDGSITGAVCTIIAIFN